MKIFTQDVRIALERALKKQVEEATKEVFRLTKWKRAHAGAHEPIVYGQPRLQETDAITASLLLVEAKLFRVLLALQKQKDSSALICTRCHGPLSLHQVLYWPLESECEGCKIKK
jgi:hypothetical protein